MTVAFRKTRVQREEGKKGNEGSPERAMEEAHSCKLLAWDAELDLCEHLPAE